MSKTTKNAQTTATARPINWGMGCRTGDSVKVAGTRIRHWLDSDSAHYRGYVSDRKHPRKGHNLVDIKRYTTSATTFLTEFPAKGLRNLITYTLTAPNRSRTVKVIETKPGYILISATFTDDNGNRFTLGNPNGTDPAQLVPMKVSAIARRIHELLAAERAVLTADLDNETLLHLFAYGKLPANQH